MRKTAYSRLFDYALKEDIDIEKYSKRLEHELKIINMKGFPGYFLVVQDFVEWARKNEVVVGPARGSAAGALTSFLLNITAIDPVKFDLLFERFLNPEREAMPDMLTA